MLRLGLLGRGRWGRNIEQTLLGFKGVALRVAINEQETAALVSAAAAGELDGVLVATPGSTHAAVALPFLRLGLPTYIEKPLATSMRDAQRLARAAERSGAPVFTGHLHLYNSAYQMAKRVTQREAGPIRYLYFEGNNNGPFRDDMSAAWDWASHDVYLALDLLGTEPTHVTAWGIRTLRPTTELWDFATIKLDFPNNVTAISTTSWLLPTKQKKLTIVGAASTVVFDDTQDRKVIHYKGLGPEVVAHGQSQPALIVQQKPRISYPAYGKTSPLAAQLQAFLTMLKKQASPPSDLQQGVVVVRILEQAHRSMKLQGKRMALQ